MSSGGLSAGAGNGGGLYYCYECTRTVPITPSPSSELVCPNCNGGFLEEYAEPNTTSPSSPFLPFSSAAPSPFSASGGVVDLQNIAELSALFAGPTRSPTVQGPAEFNPFAFLHNYITNLGADFQFVVENNSGQRLPSNLGDYFIGPGLEQLIQELAENDPNRYGTPPASKSAVQALPTIKISDQSMASDSAQCAICKDSFLLHEEAKQMPCKHIYHCDCILPWLEMHNSCPVCRYELPTDDPDYENRNRGISAHGNDTSMVSGLSTSSASNAGVEASVENAETPRRLRISLPLPVRAAEPGAGTSNNRSRNTNADNADGFNSGNQARVEDMD